MPINRSSNFEGRGGISAWWTAVRWGPVEMSVCAITWIVALWFVKASYPAAYEFMMVGISVFAYNMAGDSFAQQMVTTTVTCLFFGVLSVTVLLSVGWMRVNSYKYVVRNLQNIEVRLHKDAPPTNATMFDKLDSYFTLESRHFPTNLAIRLLAAGDRCAIADMIIQESEDRVLSNITEDLNS